MPVTRKKLQKVIAALKKRDTFRFDDESTNRDFDDLDVYPAVEDPSTFSPGSEGSAGAFLLWSKTDDAAFDSEGTLTRPIALRWGGNWITFQLAFLEAGGWVTRVEDDATPVRGFHQSGLLVLSPKADELDTDLRRLLKAFTTMRANKVIALANPGWTQSAGWESVSEQSQGANRTAVFWHSQSHEGAFDRVGKLISPLSLHWGGDLAAIVTPLRAAGFTVEAPPNEETAILIQSGPCGDPGLEVPPTTDSPTTRTPVRPYRGDGLTECLRFEADEPKPVVQLAFSTHGPRRLVLELGSDLRGSPEKRPQVYELEHGRPIAELPARSPFGGCGGLHFLPDGRLLYSLYDFGEGSKSMVSLRLWREGVAEAPELALYPMQHVGERLLTAVDAERRLIAIATQEGIVLRGIGGPEVPLPTPKPLSAARLTIRRKVALTPGPWDELGRVGGDAVDAYPMLAMSPDARHLFWTASGSFVAKLISRATDTVLWTTDPFGSHRGARGTSGLRFSNSGEQVLATVRVSTEKPQPDGRADWVDGYETRIYRTSDGAQHWSGLEEKLTGARCLAFHPLRGELAAGFGDGSVRLFAFPQGEELTSVMIDRPGGVRAIAFDGTGAQLAVGTGKGEAFVFVRE
jgi:hypothetical protein